jgi:precorrin-2/cobalt-factor-2 C20-methyltransferase
MKKQGTLYGVGVGPGDPGLITVKGRDVIGACRHVFAPKARIKAESLALQIAGRYAAADAQIHEVVFPMVEDESVLERHWNECAAEIVALLAAGEDVCFLTLGDTLLYSTHIYLVRAVKALAPQAAVVNIPGVNAYSAAAALTGFPLGEGKKPLLVIPVSDDLEIVRAAIDGERTVVLMKVGKRLPEIVALLEARGLARRSVFVARAGLEGERIETDLTRLKNEGEQLGYLSVILIPAERKAS